MNSFIIVGKYVSKLDYNLHRIKYTDANGPIYYIDIWFCDNLDKRIEECKIDPDTVIAVKGLLTDAHKPITFLEAQKVTFLSSKKGGETNE